MIELEDEVAGGLDERGHELPVGEQGGLAVGGVGARAGELAQCGGLLLAAPARGEPGSLDEQQAARLEQIVEQRLAGTVLQRQRLQPA